MRSDATLSKLTDEQQADLFDWLTIDTYDVVLKRIAQPPPGVGRIKILAANPRTARGFSGDHHPR